MKTTTKHMIHLLLSITLVTSCINDDLPDPLLEAFDSTSYQLQNDSIPINIFNIPEGILRVPAFKNASPIAGVVSKGYSAPILPKAPSFKFDLEKLRNESRQKETFRLISIGGSLSAGVRDFGYFNEGIQSSFPNLLARQMTVPKFNLPVFSEKNFNGIGYRVPVSENPTGGPFQKFGLVNNNLALDEKGSLVSERLVGRFDNLAIPFKSRTTLKAFPNQDRFERELFNRVFPESPNQQIEEVKKVQMFQI